MGDVVYAKFGNDPVPTYWREFADEFNLEIDVVADGQAFYVRGKPFTTPMGTEVQSAFAYLRPTGKWRLKQPEDPEYPEEQIEVVCLQSGNHRFVPLNLLQPFRFIDDLKD